MGIVACMYDPDSDGLDSSVDDEVLMFDHYARCKIVLVSKKFVVPLLPEMSKRLHML